MLRWLQRLPSARHPRPCAFCDKDSFTATNRVIYEDEIVVAIEDIHPRAQTHLLIISKKHIASVKDLTVDDIGLVDRMMGTGRDMLSKAGHTDPKKYQLGFHRPPFTSVSHLHLHCLGLPFLPAWNQLRYRSSLLNNYIDAEAVLASLREGKPSEK